MLCCKVNQLLKEQFEMFNDAGQRIIAGSPVLTRMLQRNFLFASP
jgi:hypothetical protein